MPKKSAKQGNNLGLPVVKKSGVSEHDGLVIENIDEDVHEILKTAFSKGSSTTNQKTALKKYQHILEKEPNANPNQQEKTCEFLTSVFFLATPSIQELVMTILALYDVKLQETILKPKLSDFCKSLQEYNQSQLLMLEVIFNSPCTSLLNDDFELILNYFTHLFTIYGSHFANYITTPNFNDIVKQVLLSSSFSHSQTEQIVKLFLVFRNRLSSKYESHISQFIHHRSESHNFSLLILNTIQILQSEVITKECCFAVGLLLASFVIGNSPPLKTLH